MVGGYQAVHLFFALSGFLITALLIEERREFGRVSSAISMRAARFGSCRSTAFAWASSRVCTSCSAT